MSSREIISVVGMERSRWTSELVGMWRGDDSLCHRSTGDAQVLTDIVAKGPRALFGLGFYYQSASHLDFGCPQ